MFNVCFLYFARIACTVSGCPVFVVYVFNVKFCMMRVICLCCDILRCRLFDLWFVCYVCCVLYDWCVFLTVCVAPGICVLRCLFIVLCVLRVLCELCVLYVLFVVLVLFVCLRYDRCMVCFLHVGCMFWFCV